MDLGITGLPLTGKTTLFNALTGESVETGAWSNSSDPHLSVVRVPDERVDLLSAMYEPKKTTPATVQYADVAGLAKGSASGSRAQLLGALRSVDALIHVVRAFDSDTVSVPDGGIDPERDIEDFDVELILADLEVIERRVDRLSREVRAGRKEGEAELRVLERCNEALGAERPLRHLEFSAEEHRLIKGYQFLTSKPMIVVVNVGEEQIGDIESTTSGLARFADLPETDVVVLCAELEMEISRLDEADQRPFLDELDVDEPAVFRLIRVSYGLLEVISFFTVGKDEVRAWTLRRGSFATDAAGTIHSDLERGFIRAEVVTYEELMGVGSTAAARERGTLRLEGKNYVVQDGDVLNIRFNV